MNQFDRIEDYFRAILHLYVNLDMLSSHSEYNDGELKIIYNHYLPSQSFYDTIEIIFEEKSLLFEMDWIEIDKLKNKDGKFTEETISELELNSNDIIYSIHNILNNSNLDILEEYLEKICDHLKKS